MSVEQKIKDIAELEYSLWVVNTYAAGIQQKDGKYITKYFPMSPFVIENMLLENGSMDVISRDIRQTRSSGFALILIVKIKMIQMYMNYMKNVYYRLYRC